MKGAIFTYMLTGAGIVAPLVNPFAGLLIYVCFAILRPQFLWAHSLPAGGRFSLITALALLVGWLSHGLGSWRFGRARGVVLALLVFWAWLTVSALNAPDKALAWGHVESISKGLLPWVVAITLIESVRHLKDIAWLIVLCAGYWAYEFNQQYYAGRINPNDWHFGDLDNNGVAIWMSTAMGLAFFLGLHSKAWWRKLLAFSAVCLMAHVILFSMSRGGMLALGAVGIVTFLIIPKRPGHYAAFLVATLAILQLAGPQVVEEFSTIFAEEEQRDVSAQSRVELTKAMVDAMLNHPITGLGPRHWPLHAPEYGFVLGKAGHNTWAQVGAETGILGAGSLMAFYLICMARLWPLTRERCRVSDPWIRYLARGVLASLVGFCVSATFVSVEGLELPYYVAVIGAGILKIESAERIGPPETDRPDDTIVGSEATA